MKTITSYKELLESFIKQIKESEVTDERIVDLHMYIDNSLELAKYYDGKKQMSFDEFTSLDKYKQFTRTATWCSYLAEAYEKFKNNNFSNN